MSSPPPCAWPWGEHHAALVTLIRSGPSSTSSFDPLLTALEGVGERPPADVLQERLCTLAAGLAGADPLVRELVRAEAIARDETPVGLGEFVQESRAIDGLGPGIRIGEQQAPPGSPTARLAASCGQGGVHEPCGSAHPEREAGRKALHKKVVDGEATAETSDDVGFAAVWVKDIPKDTGLTNAVIDPVKCDTVDPKITALWGQVEPGAGWTATDFSNLNNHSVVIRVDFGSASLLVTGDLQEVAIRDLLARYKDKSLLDVDVYQVGHHGSHNATTAALLRAITPDIAVIAMGPSSRQTDWTAWAYGHPRKVVVDLLRAQVRKARPKTTVQVATAVKTFTAVPLEPAIYATGWDGTVVLEVDVAATGRRSMSPP